MPRSAVASSQMTLCNRNQWPLMVGRILPRPFDEPAESTATDLHRMLAEATEALHRQGTKALVLPAGTIRADLLPTLWQLVRWIGDQCGQRGIDLLLAGDIVHGEDWAPLRPLRESFVFGFSKGQWRIPGLPRIEAPHRIRAHHLRGRVMLLGDRPVCAILGTELFAKGLREAVAALEVDALVVLSHHAPTRRWNTVLRMLADSAPTVVVSATRRPCAFDHQGRSWEQTPVVHLPDLAIDSLKLSTDDPSESRLRSDVCSGV